MAYPPFTIFLKDKVTLRSHSNFYQKYLPSSILTNPIHLPIFHSKSHLEKEEVLLHTLDVRKAVAFCVDRTEPFRKTPKLFVSIANRLKMSAVSKQRLSKCISNCISCCYQSCNHQAHSDIQIHSTWSISTSAAFLKNVPVTRGGLEGQSV